MWSTLGITASTFNLGALAFWMPTFLSRARILQGLDQQCTNGSCQSNDRCSVTFHLHIFRHKSELSFIVSPSLSLLCVKLRLRSGDHGDGYPRRIHRHSSIEIIQGQSATCGPPHLCDRPAGICPLHHYLHIYSLSKHRVCLCKR